MLYLLIMPLPAQTHLWSQLRPVGSTSILMACQCLLAGRILITTQPVTTKAYIIMKAKAGLIIHHILLGMVVLMHDLTLMKQDQTTG